MTEDLENCDTPTQQCIVSILYISLPEMPQTCKVTMFIPMPHL